MPVDPTYPAQRQAAIIDDVRPAVLLKQPSLRKPTAGPDCLVLDIDASFADEASAGVLEGQPTTAPAGDVARDPTMKPTASELATVPEGQAAPRARTEHGQTAHGR